MPSRRQTKKKWKKTKGRKEQKRRWKEGYRRQRESDKKLRHPKK